MLYYLPELCNDNLNLSINYPSELYSLNDQNPVFFNEPILSYKTRDQITDTFILPKRKNNNITVSIIKDNEMMDKWALIYKLFKDSYFSKEYLFDNTMFNEIDKAFRYSLDQILRLEPSVITTGVSEDKCIYIYAEINGKKVHFDIFFENRKAEVLLNITENKLPVCMYEGSLKKSIDKLKEITCNIEYAEDPYELSTTFTTTI